MSSFRCGCERGEVVSGGRRSSSWWRRQFRARRGLHPGATSLRVRVVCIERAVEWVVRLHACAPPRSREGGRESCPAGGASMAVSAGPAVPPRSVFSFRVRCGFRCSLVLGLVVVDRAVRLADGRSAWNRAGGSPAVARLVCVETVRPLRGHARSRAGVVVRLRVLGRQRRRADRRPSGEAIGAERRRVENSRRRPSAAASTQASYGSGAARLAAVLERDALGRRLFFITCTFRLLAPSVRPPRVGRRCRRTTVRMISSSGVFRFRDALATALPERPDSSEIEQLEDGATERESVFHFVRSTQRP